MLGVEGATRLLTFIVGLDKTYEATIRLGVAHRHRRRRRPDHGESGCRGPRRLRAHRRAIAALTGRDLAGAQHVSAIKVDGRRAYDLARAGEEVELKARDVTVSRFDVLGRARRGRRSIDLDVVVDCSSGTYIRALARDLGAALGVGGHLTALRRTRIGPFDVDGRGIRRRARRRAAARPRPTVATAVLGRLDVTGRRGARPPPRQAPRAAPRPGSRATPTAAVDPDGALVGIVERRGDDVKSVMNMPEEAAR